MFVVPAIVASILVGVGLGLVPPINQYLHWNLWVFLPVSGMLFGAALAWTHFMSAKTLRLRISSHEKRILSFGIVLAYVSTDLGLYLSQTVAVQGLNDLRDGDYKAWQLFSFVEYMQARLSSSSIQTLHAGTFELYSTGTVLSYVCDLLGAGLGAWITFEKLAFELPYCDQCARYMEVTESSVIHFSPGTDLAQVHGKVVELGKGKDCNAIVDYLGSLAVVDDPDVCRAKVAIGRAVCRTCAAQAVTGRFFQVERFDWLEAPEISFSIHA